MFCDGRRGQRLGHGNRDGHLAKLLLDTMSVGYVDMVDVQRGLLSLGMPAAELDGLFWVRKGKTYRFRIGWKGLCVDLLRLVVRWMI